MPTSTLQKVILSWPSQLNSRDFLLREDGDTKSSWMQVAKTGEFVSQRYGEFAITKADLAQMLHNFNEITPIAPTRLPVDYDHLSMDPKKPGDGMAAGWITELELRGEGDELWGLVEWTPSAADSIENKEYQFVSPSFAKDYQYKDGEVIGTTLLAAAITNHPFLEGMAALTLSAGLLELAQMKNLDGNPFAKKKDDEEQPKQDDGQAPPFAKKAEGDQPQAAKGDQPPAADGQPPPQHAAAQATGVMSMDVGQKVSVKDDEIQKAEQLGVVFTVNQVVGEGADAFVSLMAPDGTIAEWFRADELQPAKAQFEDPMNPANPQQPMAQQPVAAPPQQPVHARESHMKTFELSDVAGKKFTVDESVIEALAAKINPDAETAKTELAASKATVESLQGEVKNLSTQLTAMAEVATAAEKAQRQIELKSELDRMSKAGLISGAHRTYAENKWKDATDLTDFKEWAGAFTVQIVQLRVEHGSSFAGKPADNGPEQSLHLKAQELVKERRLPYRDALILASKMDADASAIYLDKHRNAS